MFTFCYYLLYTKYLLLYLVCFIYRIFVSIDTRKIIDDHFIKYYNYYRGECYRLYKGRYLYEDLFQEMYLAVLKKQESTILRHRDNLMPVFISCIRDLFRERTRTKKHIDGNTSPLNEINGIEKLPEICEDPKPEHNNTYSLIQELIDKAMRTQDNGTNEHSDYLKVSVCLHVNESSISNVSRQMHTPRYYVRNLYNEGLEYLKKGIEI